MTPEAIFSTLHLADRWRLMLADLTGQSMPPLPQIPGRRHDPRVDCELSARDLAAKYGLTREEAKAMHAGLQAEEAGDDRDD